MNGPPARGFSVTSKDVVIDPGQELTYCYYFRTPNTDALPIRKWKSTMTPGITRMVLYTSTSEIQPAGTLSAVNCGYNGDSASNIPVWTYAARNPQSELALPADDGTGKPLGQDIAPNTPAFMVIHHVNPTAQPVTAHVTLNAEALPVGATYTATSTFLANNDALSIPAMTTNHLESKTCSTPANAKFWFMSMLAHKQATKLTVKNGTAASSNVAFESTSWEQPGAQTWTASPFYSFDQDKLTFECIYDNPTNRTITAGNLAAIDERCMAVGYFFPATKPVTCFCIPQGCFNL